MRSSVKWGLIKAGWGGEGEWEWRSGKGEGESFEEKNVSNFVMHE